MQHYGLIGKVLTHSFSEQYFTQFFLQQGIKAQYHLLPCSSINEVAILLDSKKYHGLNVTIPYKQLILTLPQIIADASVQAIGATNCLVQYNGNWLATNTDWLGFTDSINNIVLPASCKALILGNGGAAAAVAYALQQLEIPYLIVSRGNANSTISYNQLDAILLRQYQLIINTTPLGMYPQVNTMPTVPYNLLSTQHVCIDLVYNPANTAFMQQSVLYGAKVFNGMAMLEAQAQAAWQYWQQNNN
jgi:shikimate dehydrogenase